MRIRWICTFLVAVLFVLAVPSRCSAQNQITCASNDGGRQYCPADTRGGVTMVRQPIPVRAESDVGIRWPQCLGRSRVPRNLSARLRLTRRTWRAGRRSRRLPSDL